MSVCGKHESELGYLRQLKANNGTTIQQFSERIQVRQQVIDNKDRLLSQIANQSDQLIKMIADEPYSTLDSIEGIVSELRDVATKALQVGIVMEVR